MLLRFRCNFVRLKYDLQLLNVPQTCASHGPSFTANVRIAVEALAVGPRVPDKRRASSAITASRSPGEVERQA
jgi:hypothetical protein